MWYNKWLEAGGKEGLQSIPSGNVLGRRLPVLSGRGGRYQSNVVTIYHVLVITIFDIITIMRFG